MAIVVIILVAEDHDVGGVWGKLGAALVARRKPGSAPFQRDRRERAGLLPPRDEQPRRAGRVPTRAPWSCPRASAQPRR
jgi:hypothetical protein